MLWRNSTIWPNAPTEKEDLICQLSHEGHICMSKVTWFSGIYAAHFQSLCEFWELGFFSVVQVSLFGIIGDRRGSASIHKDVLSIPLILIHRSSYRLSFFVCWVRM